MSETRTAFLYGSIVCLLWAVIPTALFPNPPLDVVEGYAWGHEMALGYTKHPPMQAWLLEIGYRLTFGGSYAAYWLSQIAMGLTYLCIWNLARQIGLPKAQALPALVLTSVSFYFTLPTPEFNPNILQIPVWAGMILFFHRALEKNKLADWLFLGLLAAFGLYTKYYVALLIGAIGLYILVIPAARVYLRSIGPWAAALFCITLTIPHLIWLENVDFLPFHYAATRSQPATVWTDHLYNPFNFLLAQILNHSALLIVLFAAIGLGKHKIIQARTSWKENKILLSPNAVFLLWFTFVPLGVVLLASFVSGNEFKQMWGTPMFVLCGVTSVFFLKPLWPLINSRRTLVTASVIQGIFLSIIIGQAVLEPLWHKKHTRIHYPGHKIALVLEDAWSQAVGTPFAYVAGDMWSAANVTLHAPSHPSMVVDADTSLSPWIDKKDMQEKGFMLVWRGNNASSFYEKYAQKAAGHGQQTFVFAEKTTIPPVTVNWLIIPPQTIFK